MTSVLTPDICVIGGGSGGLSVAAAAAAFGVEVVLIEKGLMGGDCLNYGCVPSKALLAAGKAAEAVRTGAKFGIGMSVPKIDYATANDHVRSVISTIAPHDSVERFEGLGVTVVQEHGRFSAPDCVVAGDKEIRARRFVIATGSSSSVPPIPGLENVPYLTNETLFDQREAPTHLVIIGGGPIGMEMAQAHRRLGSAVTVVEAQKALGKDDPENAAIVLAALRAEGIEIIEDATVSAVEKTSSGIRVLLAATNGEGRAIDGSHLLVAAGRRPSTSGLDLEKAAIDYDRGGIKVDTGLRTSNRKVYAIGDVAGRLQFTHVAGYHAGLVIRSILFRMPVKENRETIPWVTYTSPELGHIGLTEDEARRRHGDKVRILTAEYDRNDRAIAEGQSTGRLKLIAGPGGKLLGADIVGAQAGEILNLLSLAISQKMTMKTLAGFVSPYPTLGELVRRAAISYYAEAPGNPWVRRIVRLLSRFG